MNNDASIIVVGAGPVGAVTALALGRRGLRVTVIERDESPNMSPRAIVYLHPLLPDLDRLGLLDDMRERGHIDHEGFNLHLVALDEVLSAPNTEIEGLTPTPYNIHLGQGAFVRLVLEHLETMGNVDVRWRTSVRDVVQDRDAVSVSVEVDGELETVHADWLVAADGARSTVRDLIGARLEGTTWDERFVAVNLRHDFRARGFRSSNLYAHPTLPAVIAQIDADGLWRCTFQEAGDLPEEGLGGRVDDYLHALLGDDADFEVVEYRPYRMHQRQSTKIHDGRVLLVGDAAHVTNPTGGLGLTTGLYDVLALEEVLPAVIEGVADDSALDRFAQDRARVFSEVSSPTASNLKNLVYGGLPAEELRAATQPMREMTATREGRQAMLLGLDGVRSPSLLRPAAQEGRL
jgi:3-(3-hydroxy-phenyl)propionate hydroxylase/6-hydroxy-3-succinoylpyridine 3-monooxygenase